MVDSKDKSPIGNRRGSTVQRSDALPADHGSLKDTPGFSAYLDRLEQQAAQSKPRVNASAEQKTSQHEELRKAAPRGEPHGNPIGNRRTGARREPPESSGEPIAIDAKQDAHNWSDYLTGRQEKQAIESGKLAGELRGAPPAGEERRGMIERCGRCGHPIGDRRAGVGVLQCADAVNPPLQADMIERCEQCAHPIGDRRTRVKPLYARISLGKWNYYFIAKLALYWMEAIAFHPLENLVFAAFILYPVASRFWCRVKNIITAVTALTLLYYDSWLPPVSRVISQASLISGFSFAYLIELSTRFISWQVIGLLFAALAVCRVMSRWVRVDAVVVVGMLALAVLQILPMGPGAGRDMQVMDSVVQEFFAKEALRSVEFVKPAADAVPFDVIFIHVCSLAWDDVRAAGLEQHPLWKRFDILLSRFNSAASYSGPAAIHLLRSTCGQQEHGQMYQPADDKCYLMNNLQHSGFEQNVVLNHDGKFDDFLGQLVTHGRLNTPPLSLDGLDAAQYAFDKSPVYDDTAVLNRWLDTRQKSASARVLLYYNTVSMHDGNHLPGNDSVPNTLAAYKTRLARFLDELDGFMQKLDQSGRRAVVVMVPEHGAAVRGDKRQISGLREIPTPAITIVPVGIKVVGGNLQRAGNTLEVDQPTSYLAISHIVARMLENSPFNDKLFSPSDYVADLPATRFVAQTDKVTVAGYNHHYYMTNGSNEWEEYAEFDTPAFMR
jgi:cellulose synthase operon protein YhjU